MVERMNSGNNALETVHLPIEHDREVNPGRGQYRIGLGRRALLMLGTLIIYNLAELLGKVMLCIQLLFALVTGHPNGWLLEKGEQLSALIQRTWRYLLFCDEVPPWPLGRFVRRPSTDGVFHRPPFSGTPPG